MISVNYDALPLEYKLYDGRNSNVFNSVDNSASECVCRIFGLGLSEKPIDVLAFQRGFLTDHTSNPLVVGINRT